MSNCKEQKAVSSRQKAIGRRQKAEGSRQPGRGGKRGVFCCLLLTAFCLLFVTACRQDMQDQPRYEVYEPSTFFKDGLSSRPLVEGTVPRGYLREDVHLYTGKYGRSTATMPGASSGQNTTGQANQDGRSSAMQHSPNTGMTQTAASGGGNVSGGGEGRSSSSGGAAAATTTAGGAAGTDVTTFPFPVTEQVVNRGQERYTIFCSVCHGATGAGDGMVVRRGFRRPPSFHTDQLRTSPVGHFYDVITNGWGAMPNYAAQISVHDRWAIIAYIRALQLSQGGTVATGGAGGQQGPAPGQQPPQPPQGNQTSTGGHR